jgi:hypothetical protein
MTCGKNPRSSQVLHADDGTPEVTGGRFSSSANILAPVTILEAPGIVV